MKFPIVKILHLYPDYMNIYGDFGNIITLMKRLKWRGIKVEYTTNSVGDKLDGNYDLIFMGGGQDKGQFLVSADLALKREVIHDMVEAQVPALTICGGYQLFGQYFVTAEGEELAGINVFNVVTRATQLRMIGNIQISNSEFGDMVGFENHSGATELMDGTIPLGKVKKGYGNNQNRDFEGARHKNAIGTYLHGSLLPKNPKIADFLLEKAVIKSAPGFELIQLDDSIEYKALDFAKSLGN